MTRTVDGETAKLGADPKFIRLIQHSRMRYDAEGGISSEDMRRRFGLRPRRKRNKS